MDSVVVGNVDNAEDGSDKIIVGSFTGVLRIFKPKSSEYKAENLMFEGDLSEPGKPQPILQLRLGYFSENPGLLALAVLNPRRLCVYMVHRVGEGSSAQGIHYNVRMSYSHELERTAHSMVSGFFGGSKEQGESICVQSMDGLLSFFERERATFTRFLANFLVPGPLCYVEENDSIVTFNAQLELESYKFHMLAASTSGEELKDDKGLTTVKKVKVDWNLNLGDTVFDIKMGKIMPDRSDPDILCLAERSFFLVSSTGQLLMQKRFEIEPSCMHIYPVPSNEGDVRHNFIIGMQNNVLMIYKNNMAVWSAGLKSCPVAVKTGSFGDLKGMLVSMEEDGHLNVSYLGTDPPAPNVEVVESKELNYEEMDNEHRKLLTVIREATAESKTEPSDRVTMRVQVAPSVDIENEEEEGTAHEWKFRSLQLKLFLSYGGRDEIEDLAVSFNCSSPFSFGQDSITMPHMRGGGSTTPVAVPLTLRLAEPILPSSRVISFTSSFVTKMSEPRTSTCSFRVPFRLVARAVQPIKQASSKVTIDTNREPTQIMEVFQDLVDGTTLAENSGGANVLSFQFNNGEDATILVSKAAGRYRIQGSSFPALWLVVEELAERLSQTFKNTLPGDEKFRISFEEGLPLPEYFELIDNHFSIRQRIDKLQKALEDRAHQYRAIQKRLLVRFKDRNPTPLNNLDGILGDTFTQIMEASRTIDKLESELTVASKQLECGTRLMNLLIKSKFGLDNSSYEVLESYLSPHVVDVQDQGWEETTDASMTYLLRTALARSGKDNAAIPSGNMQQMTDTTKLKKHITLVCDRLTKGGSLEKAEGRRGGEERPDNTKAKS